MAFKVPEKWRRKKGLFASDSSYGNNGMFDIRFKHKTYRVMASDGEGWEHVSVSIIVGKKNRMPSWTEMCHVKDWFWDPEDCVVQYHPPKSEYVNNHPNCLHLWRPVGVEIPRPPKILVGV